MTVPSPLEDVRAQYEALPYPPRDPRDEAIRLFSRDAEFGIKTQIERGDGSEFDALREFASGMDRRAIDWKHSARHRHLLAKEFKTERNHNIVFAFDTGRLMSEPLGGVPKIDRAVTAHVANEARLLAPIAATELAQLEARLSELLTVLEPTGE